MAKKKFNPFVLLYVVSAILLIISIAPIADTARDIYSTKGRYSGYEEESLFNDFMEKDYAGLVKKVNYNKGIGKRYQMMNRIIIHLLNVMTLLLIIICT